MLVTWSFIAMLVCLGVGLILAVLGIASDSDLFEKAALIVLVFSIAFLFTAIIAGLIAAIGG